MEREFIVQQFGENCTVETTNCGLTMSPEREGFDVLYQIAVLKPTVLDSPPADVEWQKVYQAIADNCIRAKEALARAGFK